MRSLAIINQKGGVGKTTTAVNLSAALAERGLKVCLIDLDPQAHATLHLGVVPGDDDPTVYDVLLREADLGDVLQEVRPNLTVVPSHIDLAAAEVELAGEVGRETRLRDRLRVAGLNPDFLLIDCPPSLGVLTLNALCAVREVLLPLQPHFLALHGLSKLLGTIDVVARRINPGVQLTGIVLCMYDSGTRLAAEVSRDVEEFFARVRDPNSPWSQARVFDTRIRRNIRVAEAPSFGKSIFEYDPSSHGADDYRSLVDEIVSGEWPVASGGWRVASASGERGTPPPAIPSHLPLATRYATPPPHPPLAPGGTS
jgi:chromosome partitioning protein